jgi:hypothetical protein
MFVKRCSDPSPTEAENVPPIWETLAELFNEEAIAEEDFEKAADAFRWSALCRAMAERPG